MAIRKVAVMGNPILRRKADPVTPEMIGSPKLNTLIEDMIETQKEYGGIGLAAPQVHESLALIVVGIDTAGDDESDMDDSHIPRTVLLNPKITDFSTQLEQDWEGCLSLPDLSGQVKRSVAVTIQAQDPTGKEVEIKAEGWTARVFQHEIDHLYGILYVERMSDMKTLTFNRELSRLPPERETE
ncbi:MAG: peptide deformylase [Nitrospinota bacterium]|nr:peptide deformylase [Nitrospinota bacterium]